VVSMWSEMFMMKLWVVALLQRSLVRPHATMGGGVPSLPGTHRFLQHLLSFF